jgi:hypothetical protein
MRTTQLPPLFRDALVPLAPHAPPDSRDARHRSAR